MKPDIRRWLIGAACVALTPALFAQSRLVDSKGFVDGRHLKGLIAEVTAISRKDRDSGEKMWGRIAGLPGEKMTNDWVESKFKRSACRTCTASRFPCRRRAGASTRAIEKGAAAIFVVYGMSCCSSAGAESRPETRTVTRASREARIGEPRERAES